MHAARHHLLNCTRRVAALALLACAALLAPAAMAATGAKNFDHTSTGFPLTGQHENARCEDCHVRGIFKGTPTQCATCHVQGGSVTAVFYPKNHFPIPSYPNGVAGAKVIPTNGLQTPLATPCSDCHTTQSFDGAHFSHADVVPGTCNACHNPTYALKSGPFAKTANHIRVPDTVSCDQCHTTASFTAAYTALPIGHIPTSQPCSTCHNGASFVPGVMNHVGTAGTCTQCHAPSTTPFTFTLQSMMINGVKVDVTQNGLPVTVVPMSQGGLSATKSTGAVNHVPAGASCDQCHTNGNFAIGSAFKGGVMHHAAVAGESCSSCHNVPTVFAGTGPGSGGQPFQIPGLVGTPGAANHFAINGLDCAASGCHAATDVVTATGTGFATKLTPALSAAGHTSVNLPCQTCHGAGMTWRLDSASLVTPAAAHIPPDNASTGTVACASCHSGSSFGTGGFKITAAPVLSVSGHAAVAGLTCATCHEAGTLQPQDLTWQGVGNAIYLRPNTAQSGLSLGAGLDAYHGSGIGLTQDCGGCHKTSPPFSSVLAPPGHIKLSSGAACGDCHAGGYAPGVSKMKHGDVTGTCASCHYTTTVFLGTGQGTNGQPWQIPGTVGTPGSGNHMPVGSVDCAASGCHANTAANDTMTATGAGFLLTASPALSSAGHTSVTTTVSCQSCHAAGASWKGVATLVTPGSQHIPPDNLASGTAACSACHSATNFGTGGFKITSTPLVSVGGHAAVASLTCATCHESGDRQPQDLTWQGVGASIYLRPNTASSGLSKGAGLDPYHGSGLGFNQDCSSCHSTAPPFASAILPTNHVKLITPTPACSDCHAAGYAPGLSAMKHADVTGTCTSCHYTATVFSGTGQGGNGQPWQIPGTVGTSGAGNHIPINGLDCAASGCHAVSDVMSTYSATAGASRFATGVTPALSTAGHTSVTAGLSCQSCHNIGQAWFGVTTLVTPTSAHIPPDNVSTGAMACSSCHSATTFSTGGFKLSGTLGTLTGGGTSTTTNASVMSIAMHSAVAASVGACATCHESGLTTFQGVNASIFLRPDKGTASGASNGADAAHGTGNAATVDCSTCHNSTSFTGNLPTNHVKLITPTPACSDCHAAGYAPGLSAMKHADVTGTCTSCHYTATVFSGTGQGGNGQPWQIPGTVGTSGAGNHIPINGLDCAASGCHAVSDVMSTYSATAGASRFATGVTPALSTAGHTSVTAGLSCQSCHNIGQAWFGVTTLVTPTSAHIPPDNVSTGAMACSSCHSATTFSTGGFKLSGTLGTLTGGGTGTTTNASVMSISAHSAVASSVPSCATCHEAGLTTFQGVNTSIFLRPDKGTASGASNGADTAHGTGTAATGDCSGCHSPSSFSGGLPTNHMPIISGAACTGCHTAGTASPVTPTAMPHTGYVTGTCASCHNASTMYAGPVFTPSTSGPGGTFGAYTAGQVAFQPRQIVASPAVGASGGHIPLPAGDDCSVCHTVFTGFGPGTAMVHTGITSGCATCHAAGAKWYGETYTASPLVTTNNVTLSPLHVPISTSANPACEVCHSATVFTSFGTTTTVTHTNGTFMVYSNGGSTNSKNSAGKSTPTCISCHAPSGAKWYNVSLSTATMGSHQNSLKTDDCIMCHNVSSFGGAAAAAAVAHRPMAHAAGGGALRPILTGAPGLPVGATGAPLPFTHIGVVPGACVSCHAPGGKAAPKPANHLPTSLSCDSCHRTSSWLPALFSHTGVLAGTCATCHTGNWATAKPTKHMLTSRTCDTCHRGMTSWTPQTYTHLDMVYSPHPSSVTCVNCHTTDTEQVTWKYPNFKPGCAGCHGPQFTAARAHRSRGPAVPAPRGTP